MAQDRRREELLREDPGPLLDPAGGPLGEELLGIYDPDAPDEDDEAGDDIEA